MAALACSALACARACAAARLVRSCAAARPARLLAACAARPRVPHARAASGGGGGGGDGGGGGGDGGGGGALPPNLQLDGFAAALMEAGAAPAAAAPDYAVEAVKTLPVLLFGAPGAPPSSTLTLDNRVFGAPLRPDLVHRVVLWQRANARRDYYATKTQSEVSGTGKKPHAQKKTGAARAGSWRANLRRGGARAHGPVIRDWSQSLQKKGARWRQRGVCVCGGGVITSFARACAVRAAGLKVALSSKYHDRRLILVDKLDVGSGKTRDFLELLDAHGWRDRRILFLDGAHACGGESLWAAAVLCSPRGRPMSS